MADEIIADTQVRKNKCCDLSIVFAHLLLRLWVALRLIMAGIDKFRAGDGSGGVSFNMENYHLKSARIAKLMSDNSFLPASMCEQYANAIGFILLGVGIWVAIGLFTNLSLLFAGFTVLSLGFGLAALPDDTEVVFIGVHVLIIAAALATSKARYLSLDGILFRKRLG